MFADPRSPDFGNDSTPSSIEPFVRAIGEDKTLTFILHFGGTSVHLAFRPRASSRLAKIIGVEAVQALAREFCGSTVKVPVARRWCARRLFAKGETRRAIAERLHVTAESVRIYLLPPASRTDRNKASLRKLPAVGSGRTS